jgi:hypothetical protein
LSEFVTDDELEEVDEVLDSAPDELTSPLEPEPEADTESITVDADMESKSSKKDKKKKAKRSYFPE